MIHVRIERLQGASLEDIERSMLGAAQMSVDEIDDCLWCEPQVCFGCLEKSLEQCVHLSWALCWEHEQASEMLQLLWMPGEGHHGADRIRSQESRQFEDLLSESLLLHACESHLLAKEVPLEEEFFVNVGSLIFPHVRLIPWGPILQTTDFARLMLPEVDPRLFGGDAHVLIVPDDVPDDSHRRIQVPERIRGRNRRLENI